MYMSYLILLLFSHREVFKITRKETTASGWSLTWTK